MSDLIRRAEVAMGFPSNSCLSSRHAASIAETLIKYGTCPMLANDPVLCGKSILETVAELWETRAERNELRRQLAEAERDAKHEPLSDDERWWVSAIEPLIVLRRIDAAKLGAVADADQQGKLMIKTRLRAIADCIHALHRAHSAQPVQAMGTGATGNATNAEQGSTAHAGERPANCMEAA